MSTRAKIYQVFWKPDIGFVGSVSPKRKGGETGKTGQKREPF
jgi:hypothetical protein